jgi:hypothetical protein
VLLLSPARANGAAPGGVAPFLADQNVPSRCDHRNVVRPDAQLPSQCGETWNDTEAIARHRALTPSQRVALAIEISRAALRFAQAERIPDDAADVRA